MLRIFHPMDVLAIDELPQNAPFPDEIDGRPIENAASQFLPTRGHRTKLLDPVGLVRVLITLS